MNTKLRVGAKIDKRFFKLMNNDVFGKTREHGRKHRDIKLVTTEEINYLMLETNYHTAKWCSESLLAIEMKKIRVKVDKPVYLGLSLLEISKTIY